MNIKPQCPNPKCKSADTYQQLDQVFMCKTCNEAFECSHGYLVDSYEMIESEHHGTVCKPVKICLACGEVVLGMPE